MPTLQSLVLTDRKSTPVNYTLQPVARMGDVGIVAAADSSGASVTEIRLEIAQKRTQTRMRPRLKLRVPVIVTETVNGVATPKLLREAFFEGSFSFALDSTEAERNDLVGMLASALINTKVLVNDTIVKSQSIY